MIQPEKAIGYEPFDGQFVRYGDGIWKITGLYRGERWHLWRLEHRYGPNVHDSKVIGEIFGNQWDSLTEMEEIAVAATGIDT